MKTSNIARTRVSGGQEGMALVTVMLVTMLCAALMVGFITVIASDQRATGLDRDQTQAYAVAHAGLEKLTSDLSQLFKADFSPGSGQLTAIAASSNQPAIPGFTYTAPEGGSGYTVTFLPDGSGNPRPENVNGSMITAGPYQGFMGLITPYWLTVTSRSAGGAEVRLRRQLQTVAIPVFQFGMFSETDLAFHAGDDFNFGGRVHTNGNLYLAQADSSTLTFSDRITAFGHIIRSHLPNDLPVGTGYNGTVLVPKIIKTPFSASTDTVALTKTQGSLTGASGKPSDTPKTGFWNTISNDWVALSTGTYKSNIRNGGASAADNPPFTVAGPKGTGARRLDLPLVADANGDGQPDAQPIELIRRPPNGDPAFIRQQRYYTMASMRILLSDTAAEITSLPNITATQPVSLDPTDLTNAFVASYLNGITTPMPAANTWAPLAAAANPTATSPVNGTPASATYVNQNVIPANTYRANTGQPLLGGFIKIEIHRALGSVAGCANIGDTACWIDVTKEILSMGISGRNLADVNTLAASTSAANKLTALRDRFNKAPDAGDPVCQDPSPNAVIRLQRVRDVPAVADAYTTAANANANAAVAASCGYTVNASNVIQTISQYPSDYWPNVLYDTREGQVRDGAGSTDIAHGGVMHYVELDMNNLRRWILGQIGTNGALTRNDNGFIVYFSDRRGNKTVLGAETSEYGFEDTVNPATTAGTSNGVWPGDNTTGLDAGEDANQNGRLQIYGSRPFFGTVLPAIQPSIPLGNPSVACAAILAGRGYPTLDCLARIAPGGGANGAFTNAAMAAIPTTPPTTTADQERLKRLIPRANKSIFFRRALKIVNGGIQTAVAANTCAVNAAAVPCNNVVGPGLTIAAENPVYIQGNFNATSTSANIEPNVATSIIADAVTTLSNSWNDIRSFSSSGDSRGRDATTTSYRVAIVTGKTRFFPKPSFGDASFGSDGGAHNFVRLLEDWQPSIMRYRGSFVSFFYSRQATGSFKCCDGDAYLRGERDWTFDADFLLPSLLPPGTPMFRDVNTLTFRQLLRPTQGQTGTDNQ